MYPLCPEVIFQSTPPHGGDSQEKVLESLKANFNPRPLTGATGPAAAENPLA